MNPSSDVISKHSLKSLNTFGVDVSAKWFASVTSVKGLQALLADSRWTSVPKLILGGGSNILFTKDFDGLVIHNVIRGIEEVGVDGDHTFLRAASGEVWHELVMHTVNLGLGGIENLSLIPGFVGAAPIQNIGAYGAELSEVFAEAAAVHFSTGESRTFSLQDCRFGYRDSVFKRELAGQYVITSVTLRFDQKHEVNTSYGAIVDTLKTKGITEPSIRDVSNAVIAIRRSKLPDPTEIGNAGSFFKNPVVPPAKLDELRSRYPDIPHYQSRAAAMPSNGEAKLLAGWLIEQAGWKGKRIGNVGMHAKQALVLVNYGGATGEELLRHARTVKQSVADKFGVELEEEVRIIE